jgi:hypothetical protein
MDFLKGGWDNVGEGPFSKLMSIASGVRTMFGHDSALSNPTASALEHAEMGGIDAGFGLLGGPLAVVDSMTGGNISGILRAGASGVNALTAGLFGDSRAMNQNADNVIGGNYGGAAATVGVLADLATQGLYDFFGGQGDGATMRSDGANAYRDGLLNGSSWSPFTWLGRLGNWLGDDTDRLHAIGQTPTELFRPEPESGPEMDPEQLERLRAVSMWSY